MKVTSKKQRTAMTVVAMVLIVSISIYTIVYSNRSQRLWEGLVNADDMESGMVVPDTVSPAPAPSSGSGSGSGSSSPSPRPFNSTSGILDSVYNFFQFSKY